MPRSFGPGRGTSILALFMSPSTALDRVALFVGFKSVCRGHGLSERVISQRVLPPLIPHQRFPIYISNFLMFFFHSAASARVQHVLSYRLPRFDQPEARLECIFPQHPDCGVIGLGWWVLAGARRPCPLRLGKRQVVGGGPAGD